MGNPSSVHAEGRSARDLVETARRQVAGLVGGAAEEIAFTSGGTEADCLGIIGLARLARSLGRPARVVTAAIEHPAAVGACRALTREGFSVSDVHVDGAGRLDLAHLEQLAGGGGAVIAVSLANHELGTVQDIASIADIAARHDVFVHCDAVQAAGKIPIAARQLGVHTLAISAHKFHGPQGVGAVWVRRDVDVGPLFPAGHQERERRPGTENVAGIAGAGVAARLALDLLPTEAPRIAAMTAALERGLARLSGVRVHGADAPRVGNTVNARFEGALGEAVVTALDIAGFAVSTGAACTSGSVQPSPVLRAIGLPPEQAIEAVRFSLGRDNTMADVQAVLEVLPGIIQRARQFR